MRCRVRSDGEAPFLAPDLLYRRWCLHQKHVITEDCLLTSIQISQLLSGTDHDPADKSNVMATRKENDSESHSPLIA